MFGVQPGVSTRKPHLLRVDAPRLVGYTLSVKHVEEGKEAVLRLEDKASNGGFRLETTEWDVGHATNPYRLGLWRALRRLVCLKCEPKRMSFSMLNFDDFLHQAMSPCHCGSPDSADGLIVSRLDHVSSNRVLGSALVLRLAQSGKHVIAEDGICLSCCHPAVKGMLNRPV